MEDTLTLAPLMDDELPSGSSGGASESSAPSTPTDSPQRRRVFKILRGLGWTSFAIFLLVFFTLLKLPEERIKSYVAATVQNSLAPLGYSLTASETHLSIGFGLDYEMENARLSSTANGQALRFSKLNIRPKILPLLIGRTSATIIAQQDDGKLELDFSGKMAQGTVVPLGFQLKASAFDLGKSQVAPFLAGVGMTGVLEGDVHVSGDLQTPSSLSGSVQLKITRLAVEASKIEGFPVPRLGLSELALDGSIEGSKFTLTTARIGKAAGGDDLNLTAKGSLLLGKTWNDVTLDLKAQFRFSEAVKKALPPLELFLTPGLGADGQYSYTLTGPLLAPNPQPAK